MINLYEYTVSTSQRDSVDSLAPADHHWLDGNIAAYAKHRVCMLWKQKKNLFYIKAHLSNKKRCQELPFVWPASVKNRLPQIQTVISLIVYKFYFMCIMLKTDTHTQHTHRWEMSAEICRILRYPQATWEFMAVTRHTHAHHTRLHRIIYSSIIRNVTKFKL